MTEKLPILQVRNLTTHIQIRNVPVAIVDNLSFNLHAGKTLALVGESGSGKSLTALSLMRILPSPPAFPSTGEVIYRDQNLLALSEKEMRHIRGGRIAMIFQDPSSALNPVYTIGNQMFEVAELHLGITGDEAMERAVTALREVGIPAPQERLLDYPHQLSGGMRQRVMIAMALMCEPDILIADEPTTALDVTIQAQILELMRTVQRNRGMSILLITHDMGIVAEMADDVVVMYAAQAVEQSPVDTLFEKMAHPYTQGLFASRPSEGMYRQKDGTYNKLYSIKGAVPSPERFPIGCRFHPRCPYAMERCYTQEPPNFTIHHQELHVAKCWLHDGGLESEEMLKKRSS